MYHGAFQTDLDKSWNLAKVGDGGEGVRVSAVATISIKRDDIRGALRCVCYLADLRSRGLRFADPIERIAKGFLSCWPSPTR